MAEQTHAPDIIYAPALPGPTSGPPPWLGGGPSVHPTPYVPGTFGYPSLASDPLGALERMALPYLLPPGAGFGGGVPGFNPWGFGGPMPLQPFASPFAPVEECVPDGTISTTTYGREPTNPETGLPNLFHGSASVYRDSCGDLSGFGLDLGILRAAHRYFDGNFVDGSVRVGEYPDDQGGTRTGAQAQGSGLNLDVHTPAGGLKVGALEASAKAYVGSNDSAFGAQASLAGGGIHVADGYAGLGLGPGGEIRVRYGDSDGDGYREFGVGADVPAAGASPSFDTPTFELGRLLPWNW